MQALVVNAYATGNWGDAAIVEGLIDAIRAAGHDRVVVATVDWRSGAAPWRALGADDIVPPLLSLLDVNPLLRRPKAARLLGDGLRLAIHRLAPGLADQSMAAYRAADLVVSAGGGYLGGNRAGGNFLKLANIRAGAMIGRRTVVAPVTVNPFTPRVGRLIRWGLRDAATYVRDQPSRDRLAAAGVSSTLAMDIAFRSPSLRRVAAATARDATPATRAIGWAPRPYRPDHRQWGSPEAAEATTLAAVRAILASSDDRLRLFSHVRAGGEDDDRRAVDRILERFSPDERARVDVDPDPETLENAVRRYSAVDVLITSRMHGAIFAMAAGTPAVAVGYEPKVAGVMSVVGLADRVVPADERLTADDVVSLVARLRTSHERTRTRDAFHSAGEQFGEFQASLE